MCCLPTVPLCPQGRQRRKAHRARGRAPALTLTLPAPPCPRGSTSGLFSPFCSWKPMRAGPHTLVLLLLWGMWVQTQGCGLPHSRPLPPPPTVILAPCPLAQLLPAEKQTFGLYLRSHVPCAVSRLSHLCPALQLVFKSLGCPPLPGSPLVSCQAFCKEKPLGERQKGQKINKFPLALR